MSKKLLVIDTDCGVDDALAIILAFSCNEDWKILAITCCTGNTSLDNVCANVMRLTNYCNCKEIPIYSGCTKTILDDFIQAHASFHGGDGFGGVASNFPTGDQKLQPESAVVALTRLAKENKGQITLVALGPLTNVALAKRLDDKFDENLKDLVVMGGNIDGLGNATAAAEFNFACDPEAAFMVTNEFTCPMKIFPWETCIRFFLSWDFYNEWTNADHPVSSIIRQLTAASAAHIKRYKTINGYHCPDLLAMAVLMKPSVIRASHDDYPVTVELSGRSCRGQMVLDRRNAYRRGKARGNVEVISEVNLDELYSLLRLTLSEKFKAFGNSTA